MLPGGNSGPVPPNQRRATNRWPDEQIILLPVAAFRRRSPGLRSGSTGIGPDRHHHDDHDRRATHATPAITEQTTTTTTTTTPVVPVQPLSGQHTAEIEIVLSHGTVEAYFGRAARGEKLEIGSASIDIKLPSTATVTKLASRDKTSEGANRVTVDNPWHVVVPFAGGGRYVFNIVEWDHDPAVVTALLKVDGNVIFSGHGRDEDFTNWPQVYYGPGVRRTGSREVAFILPEAP